MASDNVPITAGVGTSVRTFADVSGNEWPAGVLCYAVTISPGANVLQPVTPSEPLPVTGTVGISGTVPVSGSVGVQAATTGGASAYHYVSAGSFQQDSQIVKSGAGTLYALHCGNPSASARYVKLYDSSVSPSSLSTPFMTVYLPPGGGSNVPIPPCGIAFVSGLGVRITTGVSDTDSGTASANDVAVNVTFK